jgi:UTP--glucose-1-phosphate uridylyltransferase
MTEDEMVERFRERMLADGLPAAAAEEFERLYSLYRSGDGGTMDWDEVEPLAGKGLVSLDSLGPPTAGEMRGRDGPGLVWIVLNGGLGTSMRMDGPKSLLRVKDGRNFLDFIARHVLERRQAGERLPLLFMNSFATREESLRALRHYPLAVPGADGSCLPLDFVQHRFPRVRATDGAPFGEPGDREAWAPPGHGNLYLSLAASGLLDRLIASGLRWAFVSNADNLGAAPDRRILEFLRERGLEFALEVTPRTAADVKGGTLVTHAGRVELLEIAQVDDAHKEDFQDIGRFRVFNTNSVWLDLEAVRRQLRRGELQLPGIVNRKQVGGVPVVQLETAMGAAIRCFDRVAGIVVGRDRFAPVKTTDDLLVRRSDAYVAGRSVPLAPNPARSARLGPVVVRLDPKYYGSVEDLDLRIPHPPSLVEARALEVAGDVRFGRDVVVRGKVRVENPGADPMLVPDGTLLAG